MHICVGNVTLIGSDNGLSPGQRQAIIWTSAGILWIRPLGTNFSEIFFNIDTFSFKKIHLNRTSAKWGPFCLSLNELISRNPIHTSKIRTSLLPRSTASLLSDATSTSNSMIGLQYFVWSWMSTYQLIFQWTHHCSMPINPLIFIACIIHVINAQDLTAYK